ncbi:protein phosphatase CheZ [Aerolutibacter ruishenii]|uniref:Protein phosphatase CheZ n=1 Tax=Aerolutibacter ruishenii TaxID=686800 RepID=A0A562LK60_9GAMM|nr:protein phosphatase CheZ [Lysobacter ruishenii]TWI08008.1 chemotaxis protein CheZ [Lysobacter ruishenii]
MNHTPGTGERQHVIDRLHDALSALERDDNDAWRSNVDALIEWRTQPLVQGLARLARELDQALGEAPVAGNRAGGSLPEACARLEHVVELTESASMRTLDLIQECTTLLATLPQAEAAHATTAAAVRSRLSEITAAQGYQDLTGQIILRVVKLVRAVHEGLGEYRASDSDALHLSSRGSGPAVAGLDPAPASQDDANQLLSSLGL